MQRTISIALALVVLLVSGAMAQERITDQLALARICASEVGLTGSEEECAAIAAVLHRRSELRGWTFATAARLYSSSVFNRDRSDSRAWVAHLRPDGREPSRWPSVVTVRRGGQERVVPHAPWSAYRERWEQLYAAAGRVVAGEATSACGETTPDHWGCRTCGDQERAARAGWLELDCRLQDGSPTRNAFWRVPRASDVD